jgi:hypothetical protein
MARIGKERFAKTVRQVEAILDRIFPENEG